jgi:hypothetical protein
MSLSSIFGQLLQAALSYDRYTPGDELRLDYKTINRFSRRFAGGSA